MRKLVILRGNSGSGKTTIAKLLQEKLGKETMRISQDEIRREILRTSDGPKALALLCELLKFGHANSETVILEGILGTNKYTPLLELAGELYGEDVHAYYFDLSFEETVRRHQMRECRDEFGEEQMRSWWRERDTAPCLSEAMIGSELSQDAIVDGILKSIRNEI